MPQEFQCVRCCTCNAFQVKQVTKAPKFQCAKCGTTQKLGRIFASSTVAKEVRQVVMQLNMRQGELQAQQEETVCEQWAAHTDHDADTITVHEHQPTHASGAKRWKQWVTDDDIAHGDNDDDQQEESQHQQQGYKTCIDAPVKGVKGRSTKRGGEQPEQHQQLQQQRQNQGRRWGSRGVGHQDHPAGQACHQEGAVGFEPGSRAEQRSATTWQQCASHPLRPAASQQGSQQQQQHHHLQQHQLFASVPAPASLAANAAQHLPSKQEENQTGRQWLCPAAVLPSPSGWGPPRQAAHQSTSRPDQGRAAAGTFGAGHNRDVTGGSHTQTWAGNQVVSGVAAAQTWSGSSTSAQSMSGSRAPGPGPDPGSSAVAKAVSATPGPPGVWGSLQQGLQVSERGSARPGDVGGRLGPARTQHARATGGKWAAYAGCEQPGSDEDEEVEGKNSAGDVAYATAW